MTQVPDVLPMADGDRDDGVAARLSRRRLLQALVVGAAATSVPMSMPQRALASSDDGVVLDDGVEAFEGTVLAVSDAALTILVNGVPRVVPVGPSSSYWRDGDAKPTAARSGDDAVIRLTPAGLLDAGWSNWGRVRGLVSAATSRGCVLDVGGGEQVEILYSPTTQFSSLLTGLVVSPPVLPLGSAVDVGGYKDSATLNAALFSFLPYGITPPPADTSEDTVTSQSTAIPAAQNCIYSYTGIASYFACPTGAGRCATCDTSKGNQLAWPALDSSCNCCSPSCCNCAINCKSQVYLSCGHSVTVQDLGCSTKTKTCYIVDCGPCNNKSCHTRCQTVTCGNASSGCGTSKTTPVVDLTRPTFTTFYSLSQRLSFPCKVTVTVVQPTC